MAPCPSCKHKKKGCNEDCFMRKHISDTENYEAVHKLYGGPVNIEKVINLCKTDTLKAANSLVEECKLRVQDPEGGSWKVINELKNEVEQLSSTETGKVIRDLQQQLQQVESGEIINILHQQVHELSETGAGKTINDLYKQVEHLTRKVAEAENDQQTRTERIQILYKTLNAVDFQQPNLFLLKTNSQTSLNILSGTLHTIGEHGQLEILEDLTLATAMDSTDLQGWKSYAERHNLVPGDGISIQRVTEGNQSFLQISNHKVAT